MASIKTNPAAFRKWALNTHLVLGLVAGLFLLILATTGAIIAFEQELDQAMNPSLYRVVPKAAVLPLNELAIRAARAAQDIPQILILPKNPETAATVGVGELQVQVDPYDGHILGIRAYKKTFLALNHLVHQRLVAGEVGGYIMGTASLCLVVIVALGLYLWWPLKRITIDPKAKGRRFYFDLHNAVGFFSALFLLGFGLTGAFMAFDTWTVPLVNNLTGSQSPAVPLAPPPPAGGQEISLNAGLAVAEQAVPGTTPVSIIFFGRGPYRVSLRYPEDHTPGGRTRVYVDRFSGHILQVDSSRAATPGTKMVNFNRAFHTGDVFGLPSRIFNTLVCLLLITQVLSGPYLWWASRRVQRTRA